MELNIMDLVNQTEELSPSQILDIFFKIGQNGDIILLKNDGLRDENKFTLVIISSKEKFETLRLDGNNLSDMFKNLLSKYII